VERAKAGDKCVFTGTLIVIPDIAQLGLPGNRAESLPAPADRGNGSGTSEGITGLKSLGARDLTYKLAFLACMVTPTDAKDSLGSDVRGTGDATELDQDELLRSMTDEEIRDLRDMANLDHIYARLVGSIAPSVYGHEIIKKGILLQLMGGVHKVTPEGIHLRGDINVCIVGDPSTSKSQFLKYPLPMILSDVGMFVGSFHVQSIPPAKHLLLQVLPLPSSKTKRPANSPSRPAHSCSPTTESAPSTNSIKWTSQTK